MGPDYLNNALTSCFQFQPSVPSKDKTEVTVQNTYDNRANVTEVFTIDKFCSKEVDIEIDFQISKGAFTLGTSLDASINVTIAGTNATNFLFEKVAAGDYSIEILPTSEDALIQFLTLLVKCKAEVDTEPILTRCWSSAGQEDLTIEEGEPDKLILYGQLTQGANPVLGARMTAEISDEKGDIDAVIIKDDGVSPDTVKNDGIYSGYHIPSGFSASGSRYSLSCKVEGTDETSVVDTSHRRHARSLPSHPSSTTPLCCGSQGVKVKLLLLNHK